MSTTFQRRLSAVAAAVGLLFLAGVASAASVPLKAYNAGAADLDLQIDITVEAGSAIFEFSNQSTGASGGAVAARIYFESGLLSLGLSNAAIAGGSGVSFSTDYPGPESPPGGNNVNWSGELYAIGALAAPPTYGIGFGDTLIVTFDYAGSLADLVDAVTDMNGDSRIAAHVLDCVDGNSCAAISASAIPVPAAFPLFLGALSLLGFVRRRA